MSPKKSDTSAGVAVHDLRDDITRTREDLGGTVGALADKADMKRRARTAKARGQERIEEMGESARRHPVRWGGAIAGLLAALAAVGTLRWRRSRQPKSRTERMWRGVKDRAGDARRSARRTAHRVKDRLS
jgi:hypothetical protein